LHTSYSTQVSSSFLVDMLTIPRPGVMNLFIGVIS
jgi:hypothetical protein